MDVGLSDADLAPRIADGDREAEAEMCRRMGPRIRLYGLRHLRSPSAADDLVPLPLQEARGRSTQCSMEELLGRNVKSH